MRSDWFLYHVASGHAFFMGLFLIAVSVGILLSQKSPARRSATAFLLTGILSIALSATPLPWLVYLAGAFVIAVWFVAERRREQLPRRLLVGTRVAIVLMIAVAIVLEAPFHDVPRLEPQPGAKLAVIGDSISAGMGENEAKTWPNVLAARHHIEVHDLSRMGATVESAQKQASRLRSQDTLVVMEIGGNDLLGDTDAEEFAQGLDALLRQICHPGRTVVMFELPLPPSFNNYGRIQRRLAARYGVVLIPKRILMGVLTGSGATLDTIHLSQAGHDRMAAEVWSVIAPAFESIATE